eukprot:jgi/Ulvmu1/293/UM001_0297.1
MNPGDKENCRSENTAEQRQFKIDDFEFGAKLGRGRFGNVYLVREKKSGYIFALKVILKDQIKKSRMEYQVRREVEIQANLRHPNILRMYGYFHDDERMYLILEFASGGDVYKHLREAGRFPEKRASRYIAQVTSALVQMHKKHIIHRDIKPENLLLGDDEQVRMADFGWSVHAPHNRRTTQCGTLDYLPPEVIDRAGYNCSADLWCLGVLLYEFVMGFAPFESHDPPSTHARIKRVDLKFPSGLPVRIAVMRIAVTWWWTVVLSTVSCVPADARSVGYIIVANSVSRCKPCYWRIDSCAGFRGSPDDSLGCQSQCTPCVQISDECKDLIKQLLKAEPRQRMTLAGVFAHPFIRKHTPVSTHRL